MYRSLIHAAYLLGWTAAVTTLSVAAGIFASNCAAFGRVAP